MRRLTLLLVGSVLAGCQSPLPAVDPQMAWVDFSMPTPGGKVLMAERLDNQRLRDGRFFQVTPGGHELTVRFDFEIFGGGQGMDTDPQERLCYMTVPYDHFEAGQRYRLEARSLAFTPSARLINRQGQIVAEERQINCVP
jgi:adhesin HecA-like repeat protein